MEENWIIMFGTTASFGMLTQLEHLHADGTFFMMPALFSQLYVLHCEYDGKLFPAVFSLLLGKSRVIYDWMLRMICTLCSNIITTSVITDYEFRAIRAFEGNLHLNVLGCYFHLVQTIKRKFGGLQLADAFRNSPSKKQNYVILRALIFLPPAAIPQGLHSFFCFSFLHLPDTFDFLLWN